MTDNIADKDNIANKIDSTYRNKDNAMIKIISRDIDNFLCSLKKFRFIINTLKNMSINLFLLCKFY